MRLIKGSLTGLVLAGILAMMPAAAFAHGGGGGGGGGHGFGGGGGGHAFVGGGGHGFGGGHAFGGFTGHGFRPGFSGTRGFSNRRVFLQQFAWPAYGYPYYDPPADSYLDYGPDNDYQYSDNSTAPVQAESFNGATGNSPTVIVRNTGNSRPMDSSSNTEYANSGHSLTDAAWQQRMAVQDPNEKIGPQADPSRFVPPAVPQPTQTAAKGTQTRPQARAGVFGNLVLVSWLRDAGKDEIYVQNTDTNDVQKITSEPNLDNFRLVELHPNADPKLFEAVISNGNQRGPVRFHF
jgi:hypothetical protein